MLTLGIGVTIECFHAAGGWPQDRVRLNMSYYWIKLYGAMFVHPVGNWLTAGGGALNR